MAGLSNGELLAAAEAAKFEVLLTVDQGFAYEQSLKGRNIAIVMFQAKSNRMKDLLPHVAVCLSYLESIQPGQIVKLRA